MFLHLGFVQVCWDFSWKFICKLAIGKGIITAAEGFKGTWKFIIQSPVINFDIENCVESKNIFNGVMYLSENENESENVFNILVKK